MKIIIVVLLIISCALQISSQPADAMNFMPLKIGNTWVYNWYQHYLTGNYRIKITDTTTINSKKYYVFTLSGSTPPSLCRQPWKSAATYTDKIRVDSSGRFLSYSTSYGCSYSPNEYLIDSLSSKLLNNSISLCSVPIVCSDTSLINIFGSQRRERKFIDNNPTYDWIDTYVYGIGFQASTRGDNTGPPCYTTLNGCIINGVLYGDTSLVGIRKISLEVPESYSLDQNYPNPFNPVTKIKFSLPNPSKRGVQDVKLIIYNILGEEVASLIPPLRGGQEGLSPGTYEVEWDGTNYPSGVYYYTFTAGDFKETKRMVLIK